MLDAFFIIGQVFCLTTLLVGVYLMIAEAIDSAGSAGDDQHLND